MLGLLEHFIAYIILFCQQPVADLSYVVRVHVVHHVFLQSLFYGAFHLARFVGLAVVATDAFRLGVVLQCISVFSLED
jgi:hypothetical protein